MRATFLEFFGKHSHTVIPSAPLVPDDPTLLFVNAGMVPFKNYFTGAATAPHKTAASVQQCLRAGGKHNDLDNVGYTARHHTFFEMLGNFSFGDYFKEQAIVLAHELIFKQLQLPSNRLLVTVYEDDAEAARLWQSIAGLPEERIIRIAGSDNFWSMGDTGPCGPCSEIFYDHGEHIAGGPPGSPEQDGDRFVEIWNLVFMQYEQQADGSRLPLPSPCVDTGMGLERINAVLHGTHDNYATPALRRLIKASAGLTDNAPDGERAVSHRVIADHLRASAFLVAGGVLPGPEGRGYVLRRIMRRAMRHAYLLGASEPLLHRLVPELVAEMGGAYPELARAEAAVTASLRAEEERFRETLGRGLKLLDSAEIRDGVLPGETAFKLYDTYGFPVDLTADVLRERGQSVDEVGFEAAMLRRKNEGRAGWVGSGDAAGDKALLALRETLGATSFVGYESLTYRSTVAALLYDGEPVSELQAGQQGLMFVNATPFYPEGGGQVGDIGNITSAQAGLTVADTQKAAGDLIVHSVKVTSGKVQVNDSVTLQVDREHRLAVRAAHSATHLLHEALRRHLGTHVTQKGSSVRAGRLRFDFSHEASIDQATLAAVEDTVNAVIRADAAVSAANMAPQEAIAAGALALFGEKYGDSVRVLRMPHGDESFSAELCGGTHAERLGEIGLLLIISESGVAAGVRRIEALTGAAALAHVREREGQLKQAEALLKTEDLPARLATLIDDKKRLERELLDLKRKNAGTGERSQHGAWLFDYAVVHDLPVKELPTLIDAAKADGAQVVLRAAISGDRASLSVGTNGRPDAAVLLRAAVAAGGGQGGGGRPNLAHGGIPAEGVDAAVAALKLLLADTV